MKKIVLPAAFAVVGLVGGAAAGWFLKPPPPPEPCLDDEGVELDEAACAAMEAEKAAEAEELAPPPEDLKYDTPSEFVALDRQFIVPVMGETRVEAMIIVSLTVEVGQGSTDSVLSRQPRVRDSLLRVLFDHAYSGGFDGAFTAEYVMRDLRRNLLKAARKSVGPDVRNVLIADIIRQEQ